MKQSATPQPHLPPLSFWQTWVPVGILTVILFVNYTDRFLLAILVQPIQQELRLSDTQIGLLIGFAFSACYAIAAIPLAALSDRGVRRNVIVLCLVAWSAMTALSGMCQNFLQLMLARFGVGIGEAGCIPASHAMIADLVPPRKRSFAFAVYSAGGTFGMTAGLALGGTIETHFGWRVAFLALGLPGLALALLVWAFLREPVRGRYAALEALAPPAPAIRQSALLVLWRNRPYRYLLFGSAFAVLAMFGASQWAPAFIERSFGGSRGEIGGLIAATQGGGMFLGMMLGGLVSDRMARDDAAAPFRVLILSSLVSIPLQAAAYASSSATLYFGLSFLASLIGAVATGPSVAVIQSVVPATSRAMAAALVALASAMIGMGSGPFLVGVLSDLLVPSFAANSLRWSLLGVVVVASTMSVLLYWFALRQVRGAAATGLQEHAA